MTLRDDFKEALKRWLEKEGVHHVVKVLDWDERTGWGGGCDTCGYGADNDSIDITYEDVNGKQQLFNWEGSFGDLLNRILDA